MIVRMSAFGVQICTLMCLVVVSSSSSLATFAQQTKISLSVSNVIQAFGVNFYASHATALLDEQDLAGDPAQGNGGTVISAWETSWDSTFYGPQVHPFLVIDLHGPYDLTSVWLYRGWGSFNVTAAVSDYPADPTRANTTWVWSMGHNTPSGQGWVSFNFSTAAARGSYVALTMSNPCGSSFVEAVVYGTPAPQTMPPPSSLSPTASPLPYPALGALLGVNGFALDGMNNVSGVVGAMREYDDWDWIEHVQDENAFSPTYDVGFDLDGWYGNLSALGILAHHCMQKSAGWIHNGTGADEAWKPLTRTQLNVTGSAMVASSYAVVADHAYQVAARYGTNKDIPAANLKLATSPAQLPKTGLGTMSALEVFNEVDGTWNGGRNGFFAPYEYAAMLSAAYDGHGGTMGPTMGAKQADKTFAVAHSGLAGIPLAPDYFEGVRLWSQAFRPDGSFPADALNVHTYCRDLVKGTGMAPEVCSITNDLTALCTYRDAKLPGLPLWLSEFGYDTVGGPSFAPPIGPFTSQDVQAMWLIRTVLLLARLPSSGGGPCISRAHIYMIADVESTSGGVFATSGLLASSDFDMAPKVSWWFYSTYMQLLGAFTYAGMVQVPGAPTVMAQCFKNASGAYALVVWSPTANATIIAGVTIPVGTTACAVYTTGSSMQFVVPTVNMPVGNATLVPVAGSQVVVTVTEVPAILMQ